jgi:hypothetical protein
VSAGNGPREAQLHLSAESQEMGEHVLFAWEVMAASVSSSGRRVTPEVSRRRFRSVATDGKRSEAWCI